MDVDAAIDSHQAHLAREADDAAARSVYVACRPDAVRQQVPFSELAPGDYMTAEGPGGRWVKIIELRGPHCYVRSRHQHGADDEISVMFEIPEPITVSGETHFWIERRASERVTIDATVR